MAAPRPGGSPDRCAASIIKLQELAGAEVVDDGADAAGAKLLKMGDGDDDGDDVVEQHGRSR